MLLTLQALRRLISTSLYPLSRQIFARKVLRTLPRKLYLMDGGKLDAADLGTDDDDNADDSSSGTSGSSGGGVRMRSEREARDAAEALVTLPVPGVIVEVVVVPEYFSCCVDMHCCSFDDQTSLRQLCINCNCILHLACSENFDFQNPVENDMLLLSKILLGRQRARSGPLQRVSMGICSSAYYVWQKSGQLRKQRWPRRRCPMPPASQQMLSSLPKSCWSCVNWRHSTAKLLFSSNVKKPTRRIRMH